MSKDKTIFWETELAEILNQHFELAESRVPIFIQDELKNPLTIMIRNFKFTALDFLILVYNIVARIINLVYRKKCLPERELLTESHLRHKFDTQVFHSQKLDHKLRVFFKKLDKYIIDTIKHQITEKGLNPKLSRQVLDDAIKRLTTPSDVTKLIVVETAIPIFCSYYFAHRFTKGFGPVGAMLAQALYKGQWSFWEKFLYWINLKKIPVFVTILGSAAGFTLGLVIVAPLLNALIEIFFSLFSNPGPKLIKQLQNSKKQILYASQGKRKAGATKIVFEKMNMLGEILDYVKDMYLIVK